MPLVSSMSALILSANVATVTQAAAGLKRGELVAMPTETVYGLAADAASPPAVAKLYAAKGRPAFNPLIVHVTNTEMALREGIFNQAAYVLADAFWPGPLTLVVPVAQTGAACDLARAGLDTIALRVPAHPVSLAVLKAFGKPLVAPSANPSGRISATTAQHVTDDMAEMIDIILDGGPCDIGVESTIIACMGETPALLRPGGLAAEDIEARLGKPLSLLTTDPTAPSSPGQLSRHYAPRAKLRLNVEAPEDSEAFLAFGHEPFTLRQAQDEGSKTNESMKDLHAEPVEACQQSITLNLSPTSDLAEAAANLFVMLRKLDETHDRIAVAPIPATGLGRAINDRLARAAKRD